MSQEVLAQEIIHSLAEAVQRGGRSLAAVPGLLRRLIDEGLWLKRSVNGERVKFNKTEFRSFVEADYPVGLSTTLETLEALCGHEPKVMDFIARAKQGKPGGQIGNTNAAKRRIDAQGHVVEAGEQIDEQAEIETNSSNTTIRNDRDTVAGKLNRLRTSAYNIDRETGEITGVKNERIRQLYDDVLEGRKAPNAAAVEAGFRSPKVAVRLDDMRSAARTLAARLDAEQIDDLIIELDRLRGK